MKKYLKISALAVIRSLLVLLLCLSYNKSFAADGVRFDQEKVRISISLNECTLIGDYYFSNHASIDQQRIIYYPVVSNDSLALPHYYSVTDMFTNENVPFSKVNDGIRFVLDIPAWSTRIYRIEYRQTPLNKSFEYILTTTALWNRPLQNAEFMVALTRNYLLKSVTFPYETLQADQDFNYYLVHENNFLPDKNFAITWE